MLIYSTFYGDVGGPKKGLKHADVIFEWYLCNSLKILNFKIICRFVDTEFVNTCDELVPRWGGWSWMSRSFKRMEGWIRFNEVFIIFQSKFQKFDTKKLWFYIFIHLRKSSLYFRIELKNEFNKNFGSVFRSKKNPTFFSRRHSIYNNRTVMACPSIGPKWFWTIQIVWDWFTLFWLGPNNFGQVQISGLIFIICLWVRSIDGQNISLFSPF